MAKTKAATGLSPKPTRKPSQKRGTLAQRSAVSAPESGRLDRLAASVQAVRTGGRESPRTTKLMASGVPKMSQKVIEEAAEVAIEAIRGDRAAIIAESVDLFYNLIVLLSSCGIALGDVWAEMDRREATLGMAEKLPKATGDVD